MGMGEDVAESANGSVISAEKKGREEREKSISGDGELKRKKGNRNKGSLYLIHQSRIKIDAR